MLILGLVLVALSIAGLWLCSPGKSATLKPFLRGGMDIFAALAITGGFGVGVLLSIIGIAA